MVAPPSKRRLAAILAADVVSYSRLIERDDAIPAFEVLLAERDKAAGMMAGRREVVHA